jgi:hypothetical protein
VSGDGRVLDLLLTVPFFILEFIVRRRKARRIATVAACNVRPQKNFKKT